MNSSVSCSSLPHLLWSFPRLPLLQASDTRRDYHGGKQVILWAALAQHLMFFFYLFTTPGRSLVTMWRNAVTWEGIVAGATQIYRLCLLVVISALLTLTTSPAQLAHGMEAVLGPLARVGLPVRELAMVLTIALRFVPTLFNETDRIVRAERARVPTSARGPRGRGSGASPPFVSIFVSAFRRADALAKAMEARGFRGARHRTRLYRLRLTRQDLVASLVVLMASLVAIALARRA